MTAAISPLVQYRLAGHVRACLVDDQVILLDLQRSKYLGIGGQQLAALSRVIVDWPAGPPASTTAADAASADVGTWVSPLLRQNLLSRASEERQQPKDLTEPLETLNAEFFGTQSVRQLRRLVRMWWAAAVAAHWLKHRSLAEITGEVLRLQRIDQVTSGPADARDLRNAVAMYSHLRPFVLTAHDQCLHDSLSLIRFLAAERLHATWVVGVRTRPFQAHSWVQSGAVVLNDTHENVRAYTPILVV